MERNLKKIIYIYMYILIYLYTTESLCIHLKLTHYKLTILQ